MFGTGGRLFPSPSSGIRISCPACRSTPCAQTAQRGQPRRFGRPSKLHHCHAQPAAQGAQCKGPWPRWSCPFHRPQYTWHSPVPRFIPSIDALLLLPAGPPADVPHTSAARLAKGQALPWCTARKSPPAAAAFQLCPSSPAMSCCAWPPAASRRGTRCTAPAPLCRTCASTSP